MAFNLSQSFKYGSTDIPVAIGLLKGNALKQAGVNTPAAPDSAPVARKQELKPKEETKAATSASQKSDKPGSIDPFLSMVRDLNK